MRPFLKRVLAILCLLSLAGQGCTKGVTPETAKASQRVELNVWSVIDDEDAYLPVLNDFRKLHPNVTINYRRLRLEEYEDALLNALAEDRGPDVFLVHNDWTGKYLPKILPMPTATKIAYKVTIGTIKQEQVWQLQTEATITNKAFKEQFADVVAVDTMRTVNVGTADKPDMEDRILGVPVTMDTLALYYNKDLLNAAGIPLPPETWSQFQDDVKKLVKLDSAGNIVQAAAGIGTAYNVERAQDIVAALMMQNGAEMTDDAGNITFQRMPLALEGTREEPPGSQALSFYADFANPTKETYTWNGSQPNSLDAFVQGRAAFFLGYSYHLADIRARAPKLHIGISKLPQIEGNPVKNYANYWYWAVSRKTKNADLAWNFLNYLIKPEETKKVLDFVRRPAARKSQLTDQLNDEDVGAFASQVLTAKTWYQGSDPKATDDAFLTMINDVSTGAATTLDAMRFAVDKISQTIGP